MVAADEQSYQSTRYTIETRGKEKNQNICINRKKFQNICINRIEISRGTHILADYFLWFLSSSLLGTEEVSTDSDTQSTDLLEVAPLSSESVRLFETWFRLAQERQRLAELEAEENEDEENDSNY